MMAYGMVVISEHRCYIAALLSGVAIGSPYLGRISGEIDQAHEPPNGGKEVPDYHRDHLPQ